MSTLDLTIDCVDNAAAYGYDYALKNDQGIVPRARSIPSDTILPRECFTSGIEYSDARVAAILRDFLQPGTKLSLREAAASLLDLIPANASGDAEVCSFGVICVELAEQIPYHHPSQLKFTQLLSYLSMSPKFVDRRLLNALDDCYLAFERLAVSIGEALGGPKVDNPAMWVNLNAFMANLYSTGVWGVSPGEALEMLRGAFETETPEEVWKRDCNVMAAAQWILWHGQTLFKLVIFGDSEGVLNYREHWWFGKAFAGPSMEPRSIERWRYWKAGFEAVEKAADASDECRNVANKAARMMASLEEGMSF